MYATVSVKGGGVFLKTRDKPTFDRPLDEKMVTEVDPANPFGNHRVRLVQPTAIRGLLMRLCGMTSPVRLFEKESQTNPEANRILQIANNMVARARLVETRSAFLSNVFFDAFNDLGERKPDPNVNLGSITWEKAHPIVRFLREEICQVLQEDTVQGCYEAIQAAARQKDFSPYNPDLFAHIDEDLLEQNKLAKKFIAKLRQEGESTGQVFSPFLRIAVACINRLASDGEYLERSKAAGTQVSNFTPTAPQTKPWVALSQVRMVRGTPEILAKTDWRLIIPNLSEEELVLFERGPKSATWGENGVARLRIEYHGNSTERESDVPHITVRDMNLVGFKIKLSDAEKADKAKEAKEIRKAASKERKPNKAPKKAKT
jgi:hypothetical protein